MKHTLDKRLRGNKNYYETKMRTQKTQHKMGEISIRYIIKEVLEISNRNIKKMLGSTSHQGKSKLKP